VVDGLGALLLAALDLGDLGIDRGQHDSAERPSGN
jgi:hypothetical protein